MTFQSFGDSLGRSARTDLTDEQRDAIETVLDAALDCDAGFIDLDEFRQIGRWPFPDGTTGAPGRTWVMAQLTTSPDDERIQALRRVNERIMAFQPIVTDRRGWQYTRGELAAWEHWHEDGVRPNLVPESFRTGPE